MLKCTCTIWGVEEDGIVLTDAGIEVAEGGGWGDGCPIEEVGIGNKADAIILYLYFVLSGGGILACEGEDLADLIGKETVVAVPVGKGFGIVTGGLHLKCDGVAAGIAGDDADAWEGYVCLVEL